MGIGSGIIVRCYEIAGVDDSFCEGYDVWTPWSLIELHNILFTSGVLHGVPHGVHVTNNPSKTKENSDVRCTSANHWVGEGMLMYCLSLAFLKSSTLGSTPLTPKNWPPVAAAAGSQFLASQSDCSKSLHLARIHDRPDQACPARLANPAIPESPQKER